MVHGPLEIRELIAEVLKPSVEFRLFPPGKIFVASDMQVCEGGGFSEIELLMYTINKHFNVMRKTANV